jgi:predicted nucleic acid-binding protein
MRIAATLPKTPRLNEPDCVDTDVAPYIFNWHSSAQHYADALRGSELILSFMSVAELRMGAISAGWGGRRRLLLEQIHARFRGVLCGQ